MNNQTENSSAQDFSNEVLDVVRQAERDQLRAKIRQEIQDSTLKIFQQDGGSEKIIEVSEVYPVTATLEAAVGNFKGELTVTVSRVNGETVLEFLQYRIIKFNGQAGGNKANIDGLAYLNGIQVDFKSPDSMWQDAEWHNWYKRWVFPNYGVLQLSVKFTFDSPGADPKKTVTRLFD